MAPSIFQGYIKSNDLGNVLRAFGHNPSELQLQVGVFQFLPFFSCPGTRFLLCSRRGWTSAKFEAQVISFLPFELSSCFLCTKCRRFWLRSTVVRASWLTPRSTPPSASSNPAPTTPRRFAMYVSASACRHPALLCAVSDPTWRLF